MAYEAVPLEGGENAEVTRAEHAACAELVAVEAEARSWQLRCYEAEAQLRLLKQRRRGEQHPRWPVGPGSLERLQDHVSKLKADSASLEVGAKQPVHKLAAAWMACGRLEDFVQREAEEMNQHRKVEALAQQMMDERTEHWISELQSMREREEQLGSERDDAENAVAAIVRAEEELERSREASDMLRARQEEMMSQKVTVKKECDQLKIHLEDEKPKLQSLAEECNSVSTESQRVCAYAQRRTEAVLKAEEQAEELAQASEEGALSEQRMLDDCRTELNDVSESSFESAEQLRRARFDHEKSLKTLKKDGISLRAALQDSEVEYGEQEQELRTVQAVVSQVAAAHELLKAREHGARLNNEQLDSEVQVFAAQLLILDEEHQEARQSQASVDRELADAESTHAAMTEEHEEALAYSENASSEIANLRVELERLRDMFGPEATQRRSVQATEQSQFVDELTVENERLSSQCDALRRSLQLQQQHRERQVTGKRAALDAATNIKANYIDLVKELRAGKSKGSSDVAVFNKNLKRIGRHVDDLLRFLEASATAPPSLENVTDQSSPQEDDSAALPVEGPKLPESLTEAFAATHEQSPSGSRHTDLVNAETQKVTALRKKIQEDSESHTVEIDSLQQQQSSFADQLETCEQELEVERSMTKEARATLETQLQEAGVKQTEVQMGAVAEIQRQLQAHSQEVERFGRELADLHAKRCSMLRRTPKMKRSLSPQMAALMPTSSVSGNASANAGDEPNSPNRRLPKFTDLEISELRNRVVAARERYVELVKEAGGPEAVQDTGLVVPALPALRRAISASRLQPSSRGARSSNVSPFTPPHAQPPSSSLSQTEATSPRTSLQGGMTKGSAGSTPKNLVRIEVSTTDAAAVEASLNRPSSPAVSATQSLDTAASHPLTGAGVTAAVEAATNAVATAAKNRDHKSKSRQGLVSRVSGHDNVAFKLRPNQQLAGGAKMVDPASRSGSPVQVEALTTTTPAASSISPRSVSAATRSESAATQGVDFPPDIDDAIASVVRLEAGKELEYGANPLDGAFDIYAATGDGDAGGGSSAAIQTASASATSPGSGIGLASNAHEASHQLGEPANTEAGAVDTPAYSVSEVVPATIERLQSGISWAEIEADIEFASPSPPAFEGTPSPARTVSDVYIQGSAKLIKHKSEQGSASIGATSLEFDDAASPEYSDPPGPPLSLTLTSQPSGPLSALPSSLKRFPESADEVDELVGAMHSSYPEMREVAALGESLEQVEQTEQIERRHAGAPNDISYITPGVQTRGRLPSSQQPSPSSLQVTRGLATASQNVSALSSSSHSQSLPILHAPLAQLAPPSPPQSMRQGPPRTASPMSPRRMPDGVLAGPQRAPADGRMVWSAVANGQMPVTPQSISRPVSPALQRSGSWHHQLGSLSSPGSSVTVSAAIGPGRSGPGRQPQGSPGNGPVTSWMAIAGDAMSPSVSPATSPRRVRSPSPGASPLDRSVNHEFRPPSLPGSAIVMPGTPQASPTLASSTTVLPTPSSPRTTAPSSPRTSSPRRPSVGTMQFQGGSMQMQPGIVQMQPGAVQMQPGAVQMQQGTVQMQPGTAQMRAPPNTLPVWAATAWGAAAAGAVAAGAAAAVPQQRLSDAFRPSVASLVQNSPPALALPPS